MNPSAHILRHSSAGGISGPLGLTNAAKRSYSAWAALCPLLQGVRFFAANRPASNIGAARVLAGLDHLQNELAGWTPEGAEVIALGDGLKRDGNALATT